MMLQSKKFFLQATKNIHRKVIERSQNTRGNLYLDL